MIKPMQTGLKITQATSEELVHSRNRLVQAQLRSDDPLFSVEREYPIVLDQSRCAFSHCITTNDNVVVAHANLWPRQFISADNNSNIYPVGLIGNVATHKDWQNRGLMRKLFEHLEKAALEQGLCALILWSDLHQFYQNLGFASLSREYRLHIPRGRAGSSQKELFNINTQSLGIKDMRQLLDARYKVPLTLERTPEEFLQLLTIPATYLFVKMGQNAVERYYVIGKGYDMVNVIHEWGCNSPMDLYTDVLQIADELDFASVTVLCPPTINPTWLTTLKCLNAMEESCPMALVKLLKNDPVFQKNLSQSFIWGLDSI
jgi:GNAT superfamily N-acetyltransferase